MTLFEALRALCFAVWSAMTPSYAHAGDAAMIANAIAQAVVEDGANAPVMSSHAEDAALMAVYAARESNLDVGAMHRPVNARDHESAGPWQLGLEWRSRPLAQQGKAWLYILREGARICPTSPAAPLSGGCRAARGLAERRTTEGRELLAVALQSFQPTASAGSGSAR